LARSTHLATPPPWGGLPWRQCSRRLWRDLPADRFAGGLAVALASLPACGAPRYSFGVNLAAYCTVTDACRIADVSDGYMRRMIREGKVEAVKVGAAYLVLVASVKKFERQPGMGRPRKPAPRRPGRQASSRRKPTK